MFVHNRKRHPSAETQPHLKGYWSVYLSAHVHVALWVIAIFKVMCELSET